MHHYLDNKKKEANDTTYDLAKRFDVNERTIELMQDRTCQYNFKMLKIASRVFSYTIIQSLVSFIEDEEDFCSLRAEILLKRSQKILNDVLNYIFDEMM